MDIQTAKAIDRIRRDVRRADAKLSNALAELATKKELREAIAAAVAPLATKAQLREDLADLRAELREGLAENRRHTEVLTASVRDDIRIVAEGLAVLGEKVDRLIQDRLGA